MPFSVRKITGRIGTVVDGVDFTAAPGPLIIAGLREALNTHKALVFDGVDLDDDDQERVLGWFGDLTTAHPRLLHRVTVAGEVPVGVDGRRSEQLVGDASHVTRVAELVA